MNHTMKSILAALMILALLMCAALAEGEEQPADGVYAVETCDILDAPNSKGEVLATIGEEDALTYLYEVSQDGSGVLWFHVSCGDVQGWVTSEHAEYRGGDYDLELPEVEIICATGGDSNIRVAPDKEAEIIGLLKMDERAAYAGQSHMDARGVRWDLVEFENNGEGKTGWVSSMYTTASAADAGE